MTRRMKEYIGVLSYSHSFLTYEREGEGGREENGIKGDGRSEYFCVPPVSGMQLLRRIVVLLSHWTAPTLKHGYAEQQYGPYWTS